MKLLYLGHAGILVKHQGTTVAIDPFISGSFLWNGKINVYRGESPWIGKEGSIQRFIDAFGAQIDAVAITHAHLDHFDPPTIMALINHDLEIQVIAPYPVVDWLQASSILDPAITKFLAPVMWNETLTVEGPGGELEVIVMPNPGIPRESRPYRVGYLVAPPSKPGVAHVGDAHSNGPWEHCRSRVKSLVTWGRKDRIETINYFKPHGLLSTWWIHWERFIPGNFTCSQDPDIFVNDARAAGVESGVLDYKTWTDAW
ncbi:hypothetical protein GF325_16080 [Candidatus Bathyarchaeota archaeon]|nr:hypothetical protein [Candidatus Bathyarchaeota archaeon]